jgi:hypothetical protein
MLERAEIEAAPRALDHEGMTNDEIRALLLRIHAGTTIGAVRRLVEDAADALAESEYASGAAQGDDPPTCGMHWHEAGIAAALRAFDDGAAGGFDALRDEDWPERAMRQAIAAYLARVSPSRDGTVAVEDVVRYFDERGMTLTAGEIRKAVRGLAEFGSARAGESNEGGNQDGERRH